MDKSDKVSTRAPFQWQESLKFPLWCPSGGQYSLVCLSSRIECNKLPTRVPFWWTKKPKQRVLCGAPPVRKMEEVPSRVPFQWPKPWATSFSWCPLNYLNVFILSPPLRPAVPYILGHVISLVSAEVVVGAWWMSCSVRATKCAASRVGVTSFLEVRHRLTKVTLCWPKILLIRRVLF